jgi:pimeloyl-ACP methyl ester carboxylesterase
MEARLHELYKSANFPATVLLLAELVGEGWCPLTFQGLYDPLCFQALSEGKWVMVPERNTTLQFLDVRDAVDAICRMMDKRADALGESFNLGGSPLTLSDYANLVARSNGWKAPVDIKLRKWLDFSYAIDKHNIYHDPDTWLAPEAADMLWRACTASPNKAVETLGCSFRNQAETLGQAARWCVDNMEAARRPRAPAVPLIRGEGRLEPFVAAEAYAGRRDGYIFKNGRHGKGYYIDLGPYVDFQQASWRRLYKQKTTGPEDMEKYDGLFGKVMIMYSIMLAGLLAFLLLTEAGQAHVVYMAWVSTHLTSMPRLVPKPFTVSLRLTRSKDLEELGVWHNLLPNKGYQGKFTPEERAQAPTKCRTVIYMHGNAENRNKQAWKYRWYHEEADAHVVAFDYRGFGDSTCPKIAFDTCLREAALYQDALHVFELVTNSTEQGGYGVPPSCVIFHGHSLGSAVAVRVAHALSAHLKTQIGGLILENALVSALEVSASSSMSPISQLPEPLPSMWKDFMRPRLKHELDSGKYIANVSVPVLMLHGNEDWIVPAAHTTALFQARESAGDGGACQESESGAPCSDVLFVDGAGHQEVLRDTQAKRKVLTFANEIWKAASARADR